ncbi:MAG: DUF1786 domain-containing protein [Deltaproteobacteria bacterium]|nr:DUF1786 domain-containing protein [Deltaproteobacteria bacterium]
MSFSGHRTEKVRDLLAIDVGCGTQDILLWHDGVEMENCVKLVLPSWTRIIAGQIRGAAGAGQAVHLCGSLMGGGPCSEAVQEHLKRGFRVCASPAAALTFHDSLDRVKAMGVEIRDVPVDGARVIRMRDVDLDLLAQALSPYGVEMPVRLAVAVQDHGHCPDGSNRKFRFQHWERFIMSGGRLDDTAYLEPPEYLTRMRAVRRDAPGALLMDTCIAAIRGALLDEETLCHLDTGVLAANVGNHHLTAALVMENRVWGIVEHHTGLLDGAEIRELLARFLEGGLTDREVFEDSGHGCLVHPEFPGFRGEPFVSVTGPRRGMVRGPGIHFPAPFGDMMLTGCFGLLDAAKAIRNWPDSDMLE